MGRVGHWRSDYRRRHALQFVGGSATGSAVAHRLGGSLALGLLDGAGAMAAGAAVGTVALLMPNTSIAPDSAFYKDEQYATLETGRTRVRVNVKTLPDGSVNAYGFLRPTAQRP